ncbi:MAG: Adenylate cyclase [Parcubacteria group bacterium GW2011_GWA1_47_10]|uniref:CYTH domain-containing protein n=1 Tax=Candidatus Zambryskibacteria bacterium RIFCSPHIGHO2_01_FULL_46_25 TaxID=1802738 RepID=A0A1G2SYH7_9BACT|nr:MAG: Adenylate cyclase [Parcubacteria group bacterium GW2011_GWA1_47_10]OHA90097.1 MAG: hypothetical protein A2838_00495 [Candidatus Zambryskibacteria bacterium RIFCSPHIGHO2_01_FULL_46_25]OHB06528.1 MAG: hypothetical protein A3A31_02760 [Candidatus Zambryskibacteria bacterium RIFCSPLOWO2_01_FULL_48_25]
MISLREQQKKLSINLINYDLERMWSAHPLISELRKRILPLFPKNAIYDPQDLEHQVLFRLTTFDPKDINDDLIQFIIDEQYRIVRDRLDNLKGKFDIDYLFRGLTEKYHDLNVSDRLELKWEGENLVAKNDKRSFNIDFRVVHDEDIISLFSNELHYIHRDRPRGETFGFYFAGDDIPWAIETTEPSPIAKQYKRDALLANGIDPNKAVELTRFYTLPGAPTNAVSLMDGLVARYYRQKGIEALYTTTMPMYSKTKSTTIAGGINKPLLVKDLRHKFIPVKIKGKVSYRHVTTIPEDHDEIEVIKTHPNFPTMLVVEVFRVIDTPSLEPISVLADGSKVIYITQRENSKTEKEIKILVHDIPSVLKKIRFVSKYVRTAYVRDMIFGRKKDDKKIRLRVEDNFEYRLVNATHKYKYAIEQGIKKEIEETLYHGHSVEDAMAMISSQGNFAEENSYEKIRTLFLNPQDTEITLDIYPYGAIIEIEGEEDDIHKTAKELGFSEKEYNQQSADDLYLDWIKKFSLPEMWDVRFGLSGKK